MMNMSKVKVNESKTVKTVPPYNANDIGELRGLLASARSQGSKVAIIKIPVRLFAVDEKYQTSIRTNRSLKYLIDNFDDAKLLPVTGVPHDEEGKIYLVDGYGRWQASQIVDPVKYEYLECLVILSAPTELEERRKFEAEQYAFQNKAVAKMTAIQKHGAYEVMGNPTALAIDELMEKYDFTFVSEQGNRSAGILGSYSSLWDIVKVYGKECGDYIFDLLRKAGFNKKSNGYSKYMLRALKDIYKYYPENRTEAKEYLSSWLRKRDSTQVKSEAVSSYPMLDYVTACSLYLEDLLVENLELNHVRTVDGKKVKLLTA